MLVMSVQQARADRRGRGVLASPIVVARVSPSRAWMSALGCLKCTEVLRDASRSSQDVNVGRRSARTGALQLHFRLLQDRGRCPQFSKRGGTALEFPQRG
jgi:hypothetical protein